MMMILQKSFVLDLFGRVREMRGKAEEVLEKSTTYIRPFIHDKAQHNPHTQPATLSDHVTLPNTTKTE